MANKRWLGRAQAVAQVDTVTIAGTWANGDTVTLTINAKSLVVTVGDSVTTAEVATTIKEAWQNETLTDTAASYTPGDGGQDIVEHAEITATVSGSVVTLTHDTAGVPFTLSVTETTAGSGTATETTATTATGPNFADNVDNWDTGSLPVATDDVFFDNSAVSVLYALEAFSGVAFASVTIDASYTGTIGLPSQNAAGYVEYRATYFQVGATTITIGRGRGQGSNRIKIDNEASQATIVVESTGPATGDMEAFLWKGTNINNSLEVHEGTVGVAVFGGETATISTLLNTSGTVRLGAGVTVTTITNRVGNLELYSDVTTLTSDGGSVLVGGDATVMTVNLDNGRLEYESSGTITTANIGSTFDVAGDASARTITNCVLQPGGQIIDPLQTITFTNGITLDSEVRSVSAS